MASLKPHDALARRLNRLLRTLRAYGYGLLAALILTGLVYLSMQESEASPGAFGAICFFLTVCIAWAATIGSRTRLLIGTPLALISLGLHAAGLSQFGDTSPAETGAHLLADLFFWYVAGCLIIDVLWARADLITRLLGSLCLYIVMAMAFSKLYLTIDADVPGSFRGITGTALKADEAIYFSFVTQTTLGYGDILPVSRIGRIASSIHATTGVLYIAFVVAALVGTGQDRTRHGPTTPDQSA